MKINWENLMILMLFIISTGMLFIGGIKLAFSTISITVSGVLLAIGLVVISAISGDYLYERIQ